MDYKEKYEQAFGKARELMNKGYDVLMPEIFPELQESEDERIRKAILELVRQSSEILDKQNQNNMIKWLEKQGEFDDNIITRNDEILQAISIGLTDVVEDAGWSDFGGIPIEEIQDWLEKQGEKKSADINGEDYGIDGLYHAIRILEGTVGKVIGYQSDDGILEHKAAINAVKELYKKQGEKTNPYSGMSFEYNGHIWGMCARDNGVDILLDKQLFKHLDMQGEKKPTGCRYPKHRLLQKMQQSMRKEIEL